MAFRIFLFFFLYSLGERCCIIVLNRVVLVGRLTKDPDLRYTANGVAVANFTIAVDRPFKNQQENNADFINCVVWRKAAENLSQFMKKGQMVGVDGRLQTRSFDNKEGKRVFVTEVVADSVQFLESKGGSKQQQGPAPGGQDDPFSDQGEPLDISDDNLPF